MSRLLRTTISDASHTPFNNLKETQVCLKYRPTLFWAGFTEVFYICYTLTSHTNTVLLISFRTAKNINKSIRNINEM
jgi:hypothetical protein